MNTQEPNKECQEAGLPCEFDENLELLRGLGVFSGLPLEAVRAYTFLCDRVRYQPGELLFNQDDTDDRAYLVVSGSFELFRTDGDTGKQQVLATYTEGDFIGAMALLTDIKRIFSLRAADAAVCLLLPRKKILTDLVSNPEVASSFINAIANRLVKWEERILQQEGCDEHTPPTVGISLI